MNSMKTLRWTLYLTGGILILLGLWSLFYPLEALLSLAIYLGIGLCLSGVNHLLPCFSLRGEALYPRWFLFLGIMDLIVGVLMLTRIGLTAFMIPMVVAAWLCWIGLVRLVTCIRLRSLHLRGWWIMLLSSLALIACSCAMFLSPLVGWLSVVAILSSTLIAAGALNILEGRMIFR